MAAIQIGPYADPAIKDRYFVRDIETGRRIDRHIQKLESGGWHYLDIDCLSCETREWFSLPAGDGTFYRLEIVGEVERSAA
jgi:hypothetical protein